MSEVLEKARAICADGEDAKRQEQARQKDGAGRVARLLWAGETIQTQHAELEALRRRVRELEHAARGGNAINDTATVIRFLADRLVCVYGENKHVDFIRAAYERANFLDRALEVEAKPDD